MPRIPPAMLAALSILVTVAFLQGPTAYAADAHYRDDRSRITESSLKDLSIRNDSALGSIRETPRPAPESDRGDRVDLGPDEIATTEALLHAEIQSDLHRLRRETASRQTPDDRKARVNETLDRQMTTALDSSAQASAGRSTLDVADPEFSALVDERLNLMSDDYPAESATGSVAHGTVESDLHRLHRKPEPSAEEKL